MTSEGDGVRCVLGEMEAVIKTHRPSCSNVFAL